MLSRRRQSDALGNFHNPVLTLKGLSQKRIPLLATFMDCPWAVMDCRKAAAARLSGKSAEAPLKGDTEAYISSLEISYDHLWRFSSLLPWVLSFSSSLPFESRSFLIYPRVAERLPHIAMHWLIWSRTCTKCPFHISTSCRVHWSKLDAYTL